ncbi:hypothetical protein D1227_07035 [Henriciella mobilis]|uniref:hypothetical protein n=1 Tax=Henriciella mobilis TaxID=2305467 RepID=UPI000E670116|nr:hypothetical protein [Henriciella mobilis]RIJ17101.1 hypothetical protein D1231_05635 [Henriciella mobilis]RIJ22707.1 hypothetical protein D1227_07035 [Henriciella mobilis]
MGNGNKVEMLLAICAVITSAVAVFIAWDQGRVMRAQQHGAVYPVLQTDGFVSTGEAMVSAGLRVSNSGVGPAIIESVRMLKDGEPLDSLTPYLDRLPAGYQRSWSSLTGRAIAPGAEVIPLRFEWPRDAVTNEELARVATEWGELNLEVCYCSVFKRCWISTSIGMARADRVERCTPSENDIFADVANLAPVPGPATPSPATESEVE